eukprot:TRINITY_DN1104_c0_g1_i1.p1 TRINITY_DN1104_c0_g1~~TRINITY_DN1104_c0_g1_i1.p1  ORF type:complete len:484 (+),score=117.09 TRINITY_DN1104_c0_g1_i1:109-1560(+)
MATPCKKVRFECQWIRAYRRDRPAVDAVTGMVDFIQSFTEELRPWAAALATDGWQCRWRGSVYTLVRKQLSCDDAVRGLSLLFKEELRLLRLKDATAPVNVKVEGSETESDISYSSGTESSSSSCGASGYSGDSDRSSDESQCKRGIAVVGPPEISLERPTKRRKVGASNAATLLALPRKKLFQLQWQSDAQADGQSLPQPQLEPQLLAAAPEQQQQLPAVPKQLAGPQHIPSLAHFAARKPAQSTREAVLVLLHLRQRAELPPQTSQQITPPKLVPESKPEPKLQPPAVVPKPETPVAPLVPRGTPTQKQLAELQPTLAHEHAACKPSAQSSPEAELVEQSHHTQNPEKESTHKASAVVLFNPTAVVEKQKKAAVPQHSQHAQPTPAVAVAVRPPLSAEEELATWKAKYAKLAQAVESDTMALRLGVVLQQLRAAQQAIQQLNRQLYEARQIAAHWQRTANACVQECARLQVTPATGAGHLR